MSGRDDDMPQLLSEPDTEELLLAIVKGSEDPLDREELLRRAVILGNWAEAVMREGAMLRLILDGRIVVSFKPDDDFEFVPASSEGGAP